MGAEHHQHPHSHDDHNHGHGHDHPHRAHFRSGNEARLLAALIVTALFMGVEVVAGFISGSLALIADAGHMFTDAVALGMAYAAFRIGRRPPDALRSYGYERLQVLAAFVNGISLIFIAFWIFAEAVRRLLDPVQILAGTMLAVAVGGFIVNLAMFAVLHGGDRASLNMRGAVAHIISDLLGSAAAILAAAVILLTGWTPADPLLSALVAALILRTGWRLARQSGHVLLEGVPENFDVARLQEQLPQQVSGVCDIHHVHVWMLTPEKRMMTLHARLIAGADADRVMQEIGGYLRSQHGIVHATIQIERDGCAEPHH